ncbi:MAG: FAD-dependent oxidoreductase, partial [Planctomycetales bacterium]
LAEVISGNIGVLDTVTPIRRLAPRTKLYVREVRSVDLENKSVTLSPGFDPAPTVLEYDHLVMTLGNVTDFLRIPGLHDHAFPFKNLGDALRLRDHLIHVLGEAAVTTNEELRKQLLTFVVAGGGFSGVEVCAELNDFVRTCARKYYRINPTEIRVILVHAHDHILDGAMPEDLGMYAQRLLSKRGVEFILNIHLQTATPECAVLGDGRRIAARTLVSSVPASPNPVVAALGVPQERGRIKADLKMQVEGFTNLWSLGDCALIPNPSGEGFCPPTAQFAIRQGTTCAQNVLAAIDGRQQTDFRFTELGKMASLGHRRAIARLFNLFNLHGFIAWLFWRAAYWSKLPGLDRKIKVGASWFIDIFCGPELVQTKLDAPPGMLEQHFEPGEIVVKEGNPVDRLLIITAGKGEVFLDRGGAGDEVLEELRAGDCFGVAAILDNELCSVSLRCIESMTVIGYKRKELAPLLGVAALRDALDELRCEKESGETLGECDDEM